MNYAHILMLLAVIFKVILGLKSRKNYEVVAMPRRIDWSLIEKKVITDYLNCKTSAEIGAEHDIKPATIRKFLQKQGIGSPRYYSQEDILTVKKYAGIKTAKELGIMLGVSKDSIKQLVSRHNISLKKGRRRTVHYEKFFSIQKPLQGYIAGLFAADATIYEDGSLAFSLSTEDREIVKFVKNQLQYDGTLTTDKSHQPLQKDQKKFQIHRAIKLTRDLKHFYNLTPRKTHTLTPPNEGILETPTLLAFIGGFIEGDGSIQPNNNSLSVGIEIASFQFAQWLADKISMLTGGNAWLKQRRHKDRKKTYWSVGVSGKNARLLCKQIMELDVVRMDRKWSIAAEKIKYHKFKDKF